MQIKENPAWIYYLGDRVEEERKYIKGKFMTFGLFPVNARTKSLIKKALDEEVVFAVKHSQEGYVNPRSADPDKYVICWYSTDEKEDLSKLAEFLVKNGLVQITKAGKLYNISFKYDSQTRSGQYGDSFVAQIGLADFIDLDTGKLTGEDNS